VVARPLRRAIQALAADWDAFWRQMRVGLGGGRTRPGLYPYRFERRRPDGGWDRTRLHLRVAPDGSAVLLANATEAFHLSPLATEMARMMLDGISPPRVEAVVRRWYPAIPAEQLRTDLQRVAALVAALREPRAGCPGCQLELTRTEVFSRRPQAPYRADLALTYACNNHCGHCYNEPERVQMPSLPAAQWRRVLQILARVGVPQVVFTGGEPTLHPDLVRFVAWAEELGLVCGLNTNGRRLAENGLARRLARAGLDHVQVTLASHRAEVHDRVVGAPAHAQTVAGIRAALDAGLHTLTNTTLTRDNAAEALQIVDFVHSLGLRTFAMNGMICSGAGRCNPKTLAEPELIPVLEAVRDRAAELGMRFLWYTPTEYCRLNPLSLELGPKSCTAAEYSLCVEPNGDVLPCQSYYEPVGNLLRDPWEALWESPTFRRLRQRRERPAAAGLPPRCHHCPDLAVCGGGCPLQRAERGA
jgi:radical SAM protein with 4Fe4S-binding SPASM domain